MAVFMTAWFFYGSLWILRSSILVNCAGKPKFRYEPQKSYNASLGHSVKLKCPVTGTNGPEHNKTLVAWFNKDGKVIQNTHPDHIRFLIVNEKHLKIVSVEEQDAGIYTCTAVNQHGQTELNIELKVKPAKKLIRGKPPKFKHFIRPKKTYRTGETAKLRCHSTGNPDPKVKWYKDGKAYGLEDKRTSVEPDGWTLNLRYLTVQQTGNYTCRVSNNVGSINRTFRVVVKARRLTPIIEEPLVSKRTANQGRTVRFDCKVTSVGDVVFIWRWSGKKPNSSVDLINSNQFGTKYIGNYTKTQVVSMNRFYFDGFLVIRNVKKEDEGKYTCIVKNSHGSEVKLFFLRVREKADHELSTTPKRTFPVPTKQKKQKVDSTESEVSIVVVAVLAATVIAGMIFIVVLVICCRIQRKNLEKQYVNEYQPQDLYQPYSQQQISIYQQMQTQTFDHDGLVVKPNGNNTEPIKAFKEARVSLQSSQNSFGTQSDSKLISSGSSDMYLANSRTSLQTTLCRTCPRETSLDYQGSVQPVSKLDHDVETRNWESNTSLDASPRNTSPQRSRESIV